MAVRWRHRTRLTSRRRKDLRPYDLRHSFGTAVYAATGDLRATQRLLGHASRTTTDRYTLAAVPDRLKSAVGQVEKLQRREKVAEPGGSTQPVLVRSRGSSGISVGKLPGAGSTAACAGPALGWGACSAAASPHRKVLRRKPLRADKPAAALAPAPGPSLKVCPRRSTFAEASPTEPTENPEEAIKKTQDAPVAQLDRASAF